MVTFIHSAVNEQTSYVNDSICKEVASLEQAPEDGITSGATMLSSSQSKHWVQLTLHSITTTWQNKGYIVSFNESR